MWRLLLVLAVVSLVGITAIEAGGLVADTEDLDSFRTPVSIEVPCPAQVLPDVLWVRGGAGAEIGTLDEVPPGTFDTQPGKELELDDDPVWSQSDDERFHAWQSATAPMCGYLLSGRVHLYVEQAASSAHRLTAGLFRCPASAGRETTLAAGCTLIDVERADLEGDYDGGFEERHVDFGSIAVTIPEGSQLRVKIVNQFVSPLPGIGSQRDWDLRWGYRDGVQSRLEIRT